MRAVYSTEFMGQTAAAGVLQEYVVPAGFVAVVRNIEVFAPSGTGTSIYAAGGSSQTFWYQVWGATDPLWKQWQGRVVVQPGDAFSFVAVGHAVDVSAMGYLLST